MNEPHADEDSQPGDGSSVRTFLVFTDLPVHYEYRVHDMPLLPPGLEVEFDTVLGNPADPSLKRHVSGPYRVLRRKVRYSTSQPSRMGITQYLELSPVDEGGTSGRPSGGGTGPKMVEGGLR